MTSYLESRLVAFHNKQSVKDKYVARLEAHYRQDEIIQGTYWEKGKGCAVGCTIHSDEHKRYEKELGIPEWLAKLEETLFENMPNDKAKEFPLKFIKAVQVGTTEQQFTIIKHKFFKYLLEKQCKDTDHELVKDSIELVKSLHQKIIDGRIVTLEEWSTARYAARSAARSTIESTARYAAWSAAKSTIESAARSAAESAARSTVESAAWSTDWYAAWYDAIIEESEYLLNLLEDKS